MPFPVATVGVLIGLVVIYAGIKWLSSRMGAKARRVTGAPWWTHKHLSPFYRDRDLPAMGVDMDALDYNIEVIASAAREAGKTVRLVTKSVRVPYLLNYILAKGDGDIKGLMCFSAEEAKHLVADHGLDDIMLAYPIAGVDVRHVFTAVVDGGANVSVMLDSRDHIRVYEEAWATLVSQHDEDLEGETPKLKVCIDMDVSYRFLGQHLGVQRSSLRTSREVLALAAEVLASKHLELVGVMGYEAQIAGLGDDHVSGGLYGYAVRAVQTLSMADVRARRGAVRDGLRGLGVELEYFNGGGSGSLVATASDPAVTEVAVGSGFLQARLFDFYRSNRCVPAFAFGMRVTRVPEAGVVTLQSGGFIASGGAGADKQPIPILPPGLVATGGEGFGEVQTPLMCASPSARALGVGDVVVVRPAKSGEIAERFASYFLFRGRGEGGGGSDDCDEDPESVPTYRGSGWTFY